MNKTERKIKISAPLSFFAVSAAAVCCVFAAALFFSHYNTQPPPVQSQGIQMQKDVQDIAESAESAAKTKAQGIQMPVYPDISLHAGDTRFPVSLNNPEGNPCYFSFTIYLDGSDSPIYTSGLISPGKALKGFDANAPVASGTHTLTYKISTFSLEDGITPMNGAQIRTKLTVS